MPKVNDVFEFLDSFAPVGMKMETDNVGFLVGRGQAEVKKTLVSLDITSDVVSEAVELGADLIVSHHPLFFSLKSVTDADNTGKKIVRMLSAGISAICMHTNLDAARGGVNDALAVAAGIADDSVEAELLTEDRMLETGEVYSYGRFGYLKSPCSMAEFLERIKTALQADALRYHDAGRMVYKIAVVGGSGGDEFENAVKLDCDTFISADLKYNVFLEAKELGINLIDGGHFHTENLVVDTVAERLRTAFGDVEVIVSQRHDAVVKFY